MVMYDNEFKTKFKPRIKLNHNIHKIWKHPCTQSRRDGGLMVSALDSGSDGPGSSPSRGHCVVFLGKTLYSHSASLHPGV